MSPLERQRPDLKPARWPRLAIIALAAIAGGCQKYERAPLDLAAHQSAFLARTPDAPEVHAYAESLRTAESTCAAPATFDPSDGVSLHEAELIALVFNADLRTARARAGVALASAQNAGLWEDPVLGVDLVRIVQGTPEPWKVFTTVGLTIPISGRLALEKQRAGLEHAAELARLAQSEWRTRMDVRRAWAEWSAASATLDSTRAFLSRMDQALEVVGKMEQANEMPRTEARLFRIERAEKASECVQLESRARRAALSLRRLMGLSPTAEIALTPGQPVTESPEAPTDRDELALRSPAMLIAAAEYEVAEKTLEAEVREQYPDLQIGPGYGREDGQDQVLFNFSLPLPILSGNRGGIARARAEREAARAAAEATLERLIADAAAAHEHAQSASAQRRTLEAEIVPMVDAQYADVRKLAQLGEVNTLVLLESLKKQQDAKARLVAAAKEEALAMIDIAELTGPAPRNDNESDRRTP